MTMKNYNDIHSPSRKSRQRITLERSNGSQVSRTYPYYSSLTLQIITKRLSVRHTSHKCRACQLLRDIFMKYYLPNCHADTKYYFCRINIPKWSHRAGLCCFRQYFALKNDSRITPRSQFVYIKRFREKSNRDNVSVRRYRWKESPTASIESAKNPNYNDVSISNYKERILPTNITK